MARDDELTKEQKQAILQERADVLAQTPIVASKRENQVDVLEFMIAGEKFAVEAKYVREANKLTGVTALPCTPAFVLGLINFRGQILALLDLREFLELKTRDIDQTDLQIVVLQNEHIQSGFAVDEIIGISSIPERELQSPKQLVSSKVAPLLKGVRLDQLSLIDVEKLFADPRLVVEAMP